MGDGIGGLRARMDEVTLEMVRLLKERADVARAIGDVKRGAGMGVTDAGREEALRRKVSALCGEIGLDPSAAARLLNLLLNESVKVQSAGRRTHMSVFARAREIEARGGRVIHMEVGEPDFGPPPEAARGLAEACDMGRVRYGDAAGARGLREAAAAYASARAGVPVDASSVLVTPGGRFAVFLAFSALLDPGDEVVVIEPAWPAYRDCALHAGAKVRVVRTELEGGWVPRLADVEEAAAGARMIVINYPNNPTGAVLPPDVQRGIADIARGRGAYLLSDEIYSEYAPAGWRSALSHGYGGTIAVQSLSKSHAMTGFRIGFAVAGPEAAERMARLQAMCITSVPSPVQHAAELALGADVSANPALVRSRLDALCRRAGEMGLEFARPGGGMYLFARAPGAPDGAEVADRLLGEGVAVAPGEGFGGYRGFIRIAACQDEKKLMEGMGALGRVLGSWPRRR